MDFLKLYNMPDPVCLYKWNWSTVRLLEAETNSCHRVETDYFSHENYADFHNTKKKIAARHSMLNGKWPGGGCEYCKKIEDAGGISDRLENNKTYLLDDVPPELNENNKEVRVTPTWVEVYFNNLCNMSCIYCYYQHSTLWAAEDKKYNRNSEHIAELEELRKTYPLRLAAHWEWMKEHARNISVYNILGGEPFFQIEFEQNIDFFNEYPCPDTNVSIFTNLKVKKDKMKSILDKIVKLIDGKKIKTFKIICSIDCWDKQQEYIRHGLNLQQWEENFLTILYEYPQIELMIHGTIISLSLPTLHTLCQKVTDWNKIRTVGHSISMADAQEDMHLEIFPKDYFKNYFELARSCSKNATVLNSIDSFEKVANMQDADYNKIKNLKMKLDNNDICRGTNWRKLWPWLDDFNTDDNY
jgi:organic radical activating enzyme